MTMSEETDKKIHWRTCIIAIIIAVCISALCSPSGRVMHIENRLREVELKLLKLETSQMTIERQQQQIDDLKRELEEMKRK